MPVKSTTMKTLKKYRFILAAVVLLAVLVLIRSFNPGTFRYDAVKWAIPSAAGENIIAPHELLAAGEGTLIVMLDDSCPASDFSGAAVITADPQNILEGETIRKIRNNNGQVVLCAEDVSVSARVWIVLSEMGIRKLRILKKDPA
jgi:hypothetical protein